MTRADSPQWITAKAAGDRAELAVAEWFRERGYEPYKSLGMADFDLLLQCGVEVKHDLQAMETNNVAIEVGYRGQASGIMTSTANYWAIVVGPEAFIVATVELRNLALGADVREVAAGDGRMARVRLLPVKQLRNAKGVQAIMLPGGMP